MIEVLLFLSAWILGFLSAYFYLHTKIYRLEKQKKQFEAGLSAAVSTINENYEEIAGLLKKNEELSGNSFLN